MCQSSPIYRVAPAASWRRGTRAIIAFMKTEPTRIRLIRLHPLGFHFVANHYLFRSVRVVVRTDERFAGEVKLNCRSCSAQGRSSGDPQTPKQASTTISDLCEVGYG